jgi:hypothetical protein
MPEVIDSIEEAGSQDGKRKNLGTFKTRAAAESTSGVQYFKRH